MELRSSGRVKFETLGQGGDMWSGRSWRGLRPAGQCLLSLHSMDGVREPRNAQLHLVVAKLGTHELDSLVVMAVSSLDKLRDSATEKGEEAGRDS